MKYGIVFILIIAAGFNLALGAEQTTQINNTDGGQQDSVEIQIPPQNSPEYWNVRTEAISQLLPLLTQKRAEMKAKQQLLIGYLEDNGMASDFTSKNIPIPNDPNVYFEILQMGQGLKDMNIPKPTKRPSWDEIMEVAMKHVVFEGYLPTHVEEGEDLAHYVEACKKKEQYGQKVRTDLRAPLDQCARMWVYLGLNNKKDNFKAYYADLQLQKQEQKAQEKAQYTEAHREEMIAQAEQKEQRKFEDAESRASFQSSKKERRYEDRQSRLQHSQSMLDARFVNSGGYH